MPDKKPDIDIEAAKVCATLRSIRQRVEGGYDEDRSYIGTIADALKKCAKEARREAEVTRDAQWYDAMKWAGIGGLMRVKVQRKMQDTAESVKSRASESKEGEG